MKGKSGKATCKKAYGGSCESAGGPVMAPGSYKSGGEAHGKKEHRRADKKARGGGIHIKKSHKGLLHKDTGTPSGKKIPESKIKKAEHSSNPAVRKRAVFADNAKHWNH